jgi:hypothetical protein
MLLIALDVLAQTNEFFPIAERSFLADAAYDSKHIYNTVKTLYQGDCFIPINPRNTQNPKKLPTGRLVCEAGLAMRKDGKYHSRNRTLQKF